MTFIDKLIAAFDPQAGLERAVARQTLAATEPLTGASKEKRGLRNFIPKMLSRDAQNEGYGGGSIFLESPRVTMSLRAGWLVRNNPLARSGMESIRDNALGLGLQLQCLPDAEVLGWDEETSLKWGNDTERRFNVWGSSTDCDLRRQSDFFEQQLVALMTAWVKGDMFYILPVKNDRPSIQNQIVVNMIEPERVATPPVKQTAATVIAGVEKDDDGAASAVWIADRHPGDLNANRANFRREPMFDKTGKRQVFQIMFREAIEQTRGETRFQAVLELFNDLGRYSEAELTAAIISAYFTVFVSTKSGTQLPPLAFGDPDGEQSVKNEREIALAPGAVVEHDSDTTITTANPARPSAQFDPFVNAVLKQIAVGIGLPMEVLLKHFTSSYSAARAEIQEAWKTYRRARGLIARQFNQPIFERWMDLEVSAGRIKAPGYFSDPVKRAAYLRTAWTGDQPGSLDPLKEANARRVDMENGVRTLDECSTEATGTGYWEKHSTHVQIAKARKEAGLATPGEALPAPSAAPAPDPEDDPEDTAEDKAPAKKTVDQSVHIHMPSATRIGELKRNDDGSYGFTTKEIGG